MRKLFLFFLLLSAATLSNAQSNLGYIGTDTATRPPKGLYKPAVKANKLYLVKPSGNAIRIANFDEKEPIVLLPSSPLLKYWRGDKTWQTLDKTSVWLSNVDNTSDLNKPISTATQTALNLKFDATNTVFAPPFNFMELQNPTTGAVTNSIDMPQASEYGSGYLSATDWSIFNSKEPSIGNPTYPTEKYWRGDKTWQTLNNVAVGLDQVNNTSDLNKPISNATKTALNLKYDAINTFFAPPFISMQIQNPTTGAITNSIDMPQASEYGSGYLSATDWSIFNSKEPSIGTPTYPTEKYWRGDKTWQTLNNVAVGLDQVNNTSDPNKPISTATRAALNLKFGTDNTIFASPLNLMQLQNPTTGAVTNSIDMPQASEYGSGYLSATDWSIFNSKEPSIGNPTSNGQILSSTTAGVRSWITQYPNLIPLNNNWTGINTYNNSLNIKYTGADVTSSFGNVAAVNLNDNTGLAGIVGFDGSKDLALWNSRNSRIVFGTNNNTRVVIDASGNVGFNGTTSPSATIDLGATGTFKIGNLAGAGKFLTSDASGFASWVMADKSTVGLSNVPNIDATNPANIAQTANYRFTSDTEKSTWNGKQNALGSLTSGAVLFGNGTNSVNFDASNLFWDNTNKRLGLGLSPFYKLDIKDTHRLTFGLNSSLFGSSITLTGDDGAGIQRGARVSSGYESGFYGLLFQVSSNTQAGLGSDPNALTYLTAMKILANRNVGILNNNPQYPLDVNGIINSTGFNSNSSQPITTYNISGTAKYYTGVSGSTNGLINGSISGDIIHRSTGGNFLFSTNNGTSSSFFIKNDGNVGIGTTNPLSKLSISNNSAFGFEFDVSNKFFSSIDRTNSWDRMYMRASNFVFNINNSMEAVVISSSGTVGIGTTSPNASSILDITSTTKGVLLPRLTTTQVNAIASPANGLTVYNTTLNTICFYNGTSWQKVTSSSM